MGRKHQVNFKAGGSWKQPPLKRLKPEAEARKKKKMSDRDEMMRRALREMTLSIDGNPLNTRVSMDWIGPQPSFRGRDPESELRGELASARSSLENAGKKIAELSAFITKLKESPQSIVTVMKMVTEKRGVVQVGGAALEINLPEGCRVGDQVKVLVETSQAVSKADEPLTFGQVVTVDRVDGDRCYFEAAGGGQASVSCAHSMKSPVPGERVQLDPTNTVALLNLGRDKKRFSLDAAPRVTWDDIGGLEAAKEAIREAIEYPIKFASTYAAYGQRPSKGILLYGPPGCGKTLLASAAANSVSSEGASGFIYVKGAELLSKWVGDSELSVRGASGLGNSMNSTVVPSFLAEMDGLEDSGAFVILGTNRPDSLDPAIVRDGRIDRRVRVGRPDRKSTLDILRLAMRGRPCVDLSEIEGQAVDLIHSDNLALYRLSFETHADELICYRDMLSGASISGV